MRKILILIILLILYSSFTLFADEIKDKEIKRLLADAYAIEGNYNKAVSLYKEILLTENDLEVKKSLADVLSWNKKYRESLKLYDEVLKEKEDAKVRLQKARILGWDKKYNESLEEYKKIISIESSNLVELEMCAKKSYWNNRIKNAIGYYKDLTEKDSENLEAMFDLSQIYSWQSMWPEAIGTYKKIIDISSNHSRAQKALEKIDLISEHLMFNSRYEYFKAESSDRITDINRYSFFNELTIPINYRLKLDLGYDFKKRRFKDFSDISENEFFAGFTYLKKPHWWLNGFYNLIEYNNEVNNIDTYGGDLNIRLFDIGTIGFMFNKERLEDSSTLIINRYYRNNYKARFNLDVNKRFKPGVDYLYSDYCDDNSKDFI
jgi:hypothetical protein